MEQPSPVLETPPQASVSGSWWSRIFNVIAEPGEVFEKLKHAPVSHANWLAPAIISVVIGWLGVALVFSQPAVQQKLQEMTEQAMEKQVKAGKMNQAQADQMVSYAGMGQKIGAYVMVPVMAFASPFVWGLLLWLGGKLLKGGFPYLKAVEVTGLSNVILILDSILRTLLIMATGNLFAAVSPTLLISDFNQQNPAHSILSALNVMVLWALAVRAIGLARLTSASTGKAMAWVYGVWIAYTGFFIGLGFAVQKLTGQ